MTTVSSAVAIPRWGRPTQLFVTLFFVLQVPPRLRLDSSSHMLERWGVCLSKLGLIRRENRLLDSLMSMEVRETPVDAAFLQVYCWCLSSLLRESFTALALPRALLVTI